MSNNKKPITLTRVQVEKLKKEAAAYALTILIATAMDEFDWTDEELDRFACRLKRYNAAVDDKLLSIRKIKKIVEDVMGIDIDTI